MFDDQGSDLVSSWANIATNAMLPLSRIIREIGLEAQEQMIHNLSGVEVDWPDGNFRVNVRTGNLRRHTRMEYPYQDPLRVLVFNDAAYAPDIEYGITGDEKKRRILDEGKPAKISKAGRRYKTIPMSPGSLFRFWTLHENSVLSDQRERPFARATVEQMRDRVTDMFRGAVIEMIKGSQP